MSNVCVPRRRACRVDRFIQRRVLNAIRDTVRFFRELIRGWGQGLRHQDSARRERTEAWPLAFCLVPCEPRMLLSSDLAISEIMAWNVGGPGMLRDMDADYSDWIEIHNRARGIANLKGYYLTDDPGDLDKWQFPEVRIMADAYLVVFVTGKDRAGWQLHTNFRLAHEGGYLALVAPMGRRCFRRMTPTPSSSRTSPTASSRAAASLR